MIGIINNKPFLFLILLFVFSVYTRNHINGTTNSITFIPKPLVGIRIANQIAKNINQINSYT